MAAAFFSWPASPDVRRLVFPCVVLVAVSVVCQLVALTTVLDVTQSTTHQWFGVLDMVFIALLLLHAFRVRHWVKWQLSVSDSSRQWIQAVSTWCVLSLCLCALGDVINRNFPEKFYAYGSAIKYTHLADSVWFFFPGYAAFIMATIVAVRASGKVSSQTLIVSTLVMVGVGALSYLDMHTPHTGVYVTAMTGVYACLISVVAVTAYWLIKAYGARAMKWVALGAVLATAADAIIGHFWIFREGYYPAVRHINWVVYFTSQALIQWLPVTLVQLTSRD
ncbi:MAG: lysoplasmalogenase family protein [Pseudomonadota bacterium]